jgi:hypothetical protein
MFRALIGGVMAVALAGAGCSTTGGTRGAAAEMATP